MNDHIIIADTDSEYIVLKDLTHHLNINELSKGDKNKIILKIANRIQKDVNNHMNELSKDLFNIENNRHLFQLKQEVIAQSVLVTGKRRYGMYVINKEGVDVEEFDAKGLELFKSNMNKVFRAFGEEFIKNLLFGKPKPELDKSIINLYKSLKTMDLKSLGKPTGVSYLNKYIKSKATSGSIFSKFELGAPSNTKAAIRYNDLLKFKKLDKKHESILEGDKIFVIDLKPNAYSIETIAIPSGNVPPEIEQFVKEYIDIDEIFESILLNKLKNLYKDVGYKFPILNENISKFFTFK